MCEPVSNLNFTLFLLITTFLNHPFTLLIFGHYSFTFNTITKQISNERYRGKSASVHFLLKMSLGCDLVAV